MTTQGVKRKLTAILSADVVGYSRLMGEDDAGTVRTLGEYREVIANYIIQYRGRVVDSPGDNLLAEFASVVDAVQCATEIQRELAERNSEIPDARKMEYRIGVNLGDVIEEGERIYGDGVNVAARLESLAEPGGICISGIAHDQVKNKLNLEYQFIGKKSVKNIKEPIRVYRVLSFPGAAAHRVTKAKRVMGRKLRITAMVILAILIVGGGMAVWHSYFRPPPIEPASMEKMAFPLPDKPSIAVLPFTNMSEDPKQEFFSDGMTEEIITALSKVPYLFVIASNSTFSYKGKPVKISQVAEELGVRYVLEGSFRKVGDKVRVTAQLIDAIKGHHLWAERYERELKDIFALQDEITMKILRALEVKLTEGEQAATRRKGTDNLDAYVKALQSLKYAKRLNKEGNLLARQMAEEAMALDPEYARPYRILAGCDLNDIWFGLSKSPKSSMARAEELAQKAISLDESDPCGYEMLSYVYQMKRQHDRAIAEAERAIALDPNGADAYAILGYILTWAGRPEEAIASLEKAIRINPIAPVFYFIRLGLAYRDTGRYEEAITALKKAINRLPDSVFAPLALAATYSLAGREEEARAEAAEVLRIQPKFSLERLAKTLPYKNKADKDRVIEALRKAGLPEKPPLPLPDKPSIAVLPFANISGDPKEDYLSDGITEQIITALSKTPKLFVIARNSVFTYKGKPVMVQQVSKDLGVRYVLEGSVQKSGDRIRITAQLIDAKTGNHLWAEKFDRDLKDIFALQDEITLKVISALQVKLTEGEQARFIAKGTENLEAYTRTLQARTHFYRMNKQGNMEARRLAKEAIAIDPEYVGPYTILALTHMMDLWFNFSKFPKESMMLAVEAARKALALDDSNPSTHIGLCMLYIMQKKHDKAIAAAERAVELSPSGANAYAALGTALRYACRPNEAIPMVKKAISLNPIANSVLLRSLGVSYWMAGKYEDAIVVLKKSLQERPNDLFSHLTLINCYVPLGREEQARAEATEVLRIHPKFSLEHFAKILPYKDQSVVDNIIARLRKAGLK